MPGKFLTAEWNNLIMANYIIDPAILKNYIPAKTELDLYQGNCYISIIGFMFENTRLLGVKIPFHVNFEEVNLRFYVRYNDNGEWKRGTVFIKEIVPKPAICFVANNIYREKYCTMPMKHFYNAGSDTIQLGYHWKYKGKWNKLEVVAAAELLSMQPGSEEEFIAEHYYGYSKYNAATTFEYNVQHPAWQFHKVKDHLIDCDFSTLYGKEFELLQRLIPASVFMAKGSAITILNKKRL